MEYFSNASCVAIRRFHWQMMTLKAKRNPFLLIIWFPFEFHCYILRIDSQEFDTLGQKEILWKKKIGQVDYLQLISACSFHFQVKGKLNILLMAVVKVSFPLGVDSNIISSHFIHQAHWTDDKLDWNKASISVKESKEWLLDF